MYHAIQTHPLHEIDPIFEWNKSEQPFIVFVTQANCAFKPIYSSLLKDMAPCLEILR